MINFLKFSDVLSATNVNISIQHTSLKLYRNKKKLTSDFLLYLNIWVNILHLLKCIMHRTHIFIPCILVIEEIRTSNGIETVNLRLEVVIEQNILINWVTQQEVVFKIMKHLLIGSYLS